MVIDWQPIAQACKDGTQILVAYRYPDGEWVCDAVLFDGNHWVYRDGGIVLEQRWTHWQPMPSVPRNPA